jgi:hypothetical protein
MGQAFDVPPYKFAPLDSRSGSRTGKRAAQRSGHGMSTRTRPSEGHDAREPAPNRMIGRRLVLPNETYAQRPPSHRTALRHSTPAGTPALGIRGRSLRRRAHSARYERVVEGFSPPDSPAEPHAFATQVTRSITRRSACTDRPSIMLRPGVPSGGKERCLTSQAVWRVPGRSRAHHLGPDRRCFAHPITGRDRGSPMSTLLAFGHEGCGRVLSDEVGGRHLAPPRDRPVGPPSSRRPSSHLETMTSTLAALVGLVIRGRHDRGLV